MEGVDILVSRTIYSKKLCCFKVIVKKIFWVFYETYLAHIEFGEQCAYFGGIQSNVQILSNEHFHVR